MSRTHAGVATRAVNDLAFTGQFGISRTGIDSRRLRILLEVFVLQYVESDSLAPRASINFDAMKFHFRHFSVALWAFHVVRHNHHCSLRCLDE